MKIFFKGYYGFENLGDDIFVHVAKWFSEKYGYKYKIHGYKLPNNIKGKKINSKMKKNLYDIYYAFSCQKIIYWGGSTFERNSSKTDLKYYITRIKSLYKKTLAMGVSIGPFKKEEDEKLLLDLINKLNYVGVRDLSSMNYGRYFNFTFDLAIIIPEIFPVNNKENARKKIISVNLSKSKNLNEYTEVFKTFLINNTEQIEKVNIVVFNPKDFLISEKFYHEIKQHINEICIINYSSDTYSILKPIANSDLLLGNRLHSGIISYAYGVPFILNEYHQKCTDFINTIEQEFNFDSLRNSKNKDINYIINQASINKSPEFFKKKLMDQFEVLNRNI
ncbi:polysaccharide pyruvyl transferase family protein [Mammaliicoccus sciuri]|uniref:polysaccharide pyruvyl transferase family protein n=1 Tax=Mammaliicoccus sciuri TaxID=1296 RepID=UPI003F555BA5